MDQEHIVDLKQISIPKGSIKSGCSDKAEDIGAQFQFQKVRLKAVLVTAFMAA